MKFDSCQAECSVPWLNEVLILFTVALQLCQQLKDKVMRTYTRTLAHIWRQILRFVLNWIGTKDNNNKTKKKPKKMQFLRMEYVCQNVG